MIMDPLGINAGMLFEQAFIVILFIGLPIISLIDLARRKLTGTPLATWALLICIVPVLGAVAYWIIRPSAESKA
jgi:hypothetical protein